MLNGFHGRGPYEGFGVLVPNLEEALDGRLQIGDAEEDAAADGLVVQMAEPRSTRFNQLELVGTK